MVSLWHKLEKNIYWMIKERMILSMNLINYVLKNASRGPCTCGKCLNAPNNPQDKQPGGHTVDLTFFKVSKLSGNKDKFLKLAKEEYPHWFDGNEHDYIEVGADMGDQGIAFMTIGLGHLLGVWKALSPEIIMPFLDDDLKMKMAGMGMVSLQVINEHSKNEK